MLTRLVCVPATNTRWNVPCITGVTWRKSIHGVQRHGDRLVEMLPAIPRDLWPTRLHDYLTSAFAQADPHTARPK